MMHTLRIIVLCACMGLIGSDAQAQTRKFSNAFLDIGVGARALGMAGNQTASVRDVTAGYWNPAGLLGVQSDLQIGAMHAEYFGGISNYDYVGFAKGIDSTKAIGLSFIRFGVDDIPNTTQLIDANGIVDFDRITRFSAADYAFILSYARKLEKGLDLGVNAKVVHRRVGDFATAWGFGLDVGLNYRTNGWFLAAMARDITTTVNAWNYSLDDETQQVFEATGNEIPQNGTEITLPKLTLGVARSFKVSESIDLLTEMNLDVTTDGQRNVLISADPISIDPGLGLEIGISRIVFIRGGVNNIQQVQPFPGETDWSIRPNFGIGIQLKQASLDYALTNIGDESEQLMSNVFSIRFDIYKPE